MQAWNTLKATENKRKFQNTEGENMKKHKINLQLFAEGGEGGTEGQQTETQQTEGKDEGGKKEPEKKYTDDDVNKMFDKKFAEWQKKKDKEVSEAKKLAEMNAQQKAEYERDQLQKELDSLKKKDALSEMTKTARKMLSDEGISVSDDLLSVLVTTDAEKTKAAVDGFAKLFKDAVEKAVKDKLKGEPPKKGSAGGNGTLTKEQIMAIKDPEARQKKMLEHKELFNF